MKIRQLLVGLACVTLAGCGTLVPDQPNFSSNLILPKTNQSDGSVGSTNTQYTSSVTQLEPKSCAEFDSDKAPTASARNACIVDLMTDIDDAYHHYEIVVANNIGATNATLDAVSTIGSTAATATGGTTAKVLSALASVSGSSKTLFNEDLLYKATVQVLISTMEADRAKDAASIKLSMQSSLSAYPMYQAKNDLLQYLYDGTLTHALAQAEQDAGATAQKCKAAQKAVSAAVASSGGANVKKPPTGAAGAGAAATTTSDQCNQIADSVSFKFDTSTTASSLGALLAPGGVVDAKAVAAETSCIKTNPAPAGLDMSEYTLPNGAYDFGSFNRDPAVDADYKAKILTCTKAAIAKKAPPKATPKTAKHRKRKS